MSRQATSRVYNNFRNGLNTDFSSGAFPEDSLSDVLNMKLSTTGEWVKTEGATEVGPQITSFGSKVLASYPMNTVNGGLLVCVTDTAVTIQVPSNSGHPAIPQTGALFDSYLFKTKDPSAKATVYVKHDVVYVTRPDCVPVRLVYDPDTQQFTSETNIPYIRDYAPSTISPPAYIAFPVNTVQTYQDYLVNSADLNDYRYSLVNYGWTMEQAATVAHDLMYWPNPSDPVEAGILTDPSTGKESFSSQQFSELKETIRRSSSGALSLVDLRGYKDTSQISAFYSSNDYTFDCTFYSSSVTEVTYKATSPGHSMSNQPIGVRSIRSTASLSSKSLGAISGYINGSLNANEFLITLPRYSGAGIEPSIRISITLAKTLESSTATVPLYAPQEKIERLSDSCAYSSTFWQGRFWQGRDGAIQYSQIVQSPSDVRASLFMQETSPTLGVGGEIIASDGGDILLPSSSRVVGLKEVAGSLMIFTEQGIWSITPPDTGFKADDFFLSKQSIDRVACPYSIVELEGQIAYTTLDDIKVIGQESSSLILNKISTKYRQLPESTRSNILSAYDQGSRELYMVIEDTFWIFNLNFQSWTIVDPGVSDISPVYYHNTRETGMSFVGYHATSNGAYYYEISTPVSSAGHESYLVTGWDNLTDPMRYSNVHYAYPLLTRTETDSSCILQGRWDYSINSSDGDWGRSWEAYRKQRGASKDTIISKNRIRGRGRSIQFKMTSPAGKDLRLQNLSIEVSTGVAT